MIGYWTLIRTKSREETLAKRNLDAQQYTTFLPMLPIDSKPNQKSRKKEEPLFPGYLFLYLADGQSSISIRYTRGVTCIVRFGAMIVHVPDKLISSIKERETQLLEPKGRFEKGQSVRVIDGPIKLLEGVYHSPSGSDRANVLMTLLGREQILSIRLPDLTAC